MHTHISTYKLIDSSTWVNCEETSNNAPQCSIRASGRLIRLYKVWVITRKKYTTLLGCLISSPHSLASLQAKEKDSPFCDQVWRAGCVCARMSTRACVCQAGKDSSGEPCTWASVGAASGAGGGRLVFRASPALEEARSASLFRDALLRDASAPAAPGGGGRPGSGGLCG